jgi:hypothetical protein
MLGRGAVEVALHHVLQACARGLQAQLHLLEDQFGLALDRHRQNLTCLGIERREPRDIDHAVGTRDRRDRRLPFRKIGGQRFDADGFSFHRNAFGYGTT